MKRSIARCIRAAGPDYALSKLQSLRDGELFENMQKFGQKLKKKLKEVKQIQEMNQLQQMKQI